MPATTATSGRPKPNKPFAITLCKQKGHLLMRKQQQTVKFSDKIIFIRGFSTITFLSAVYKKEGV